MNFFTDHSFGPYADDGFGNLIRLNSHQKIKALDFLLDQEH